MARISGQKTGRQARPTPGLLLTFEGIEGSGKTTQCARLARRLRAEGYRLLETREPGGTPVAERIRDIFLGTAGRPLPEPIAPECEAHLILACRSQHVARVIEPALRDGVIVLCDRFVDSTLAYQGYGRGLPLPALRRLNRFATRGIAPSLTLLFDLPVRTGLARRRRHHGELNRLDREATRFHEKVRQGFLKLAALDRRRIKVVKAAGDPDAVARDVSALVEDFLKQRGKRARAR